ncbi:MAG: nuclear transport factor 2 family protein [Gammaproteobacteria bacterium]|nr:nuclear transport factor 2 family protein [Gammaproteobacteria bacterium]
MQSVTKLVGIFGLMLGGWLAVPLAAADDTATRLDALEAREAIRTLMHEYGRTLDRRDFAAFGALFATSGTYTSGGRTETGPAAIGAMLQAQFAANPAGIKDPNFHVFFNEIIEVHGETASAWSQSAYVVPADDATPRMLFYATYDDEYVKENGQWKFRQRIVKGDMPRRAR